MFRKLSLDLLAMDDCHFHLRQNVVSFLKQRNPNIVIAPLCFSVAWDWYVFVNDGLLGGNIRSV